MKKRGFTLIELIAVIVVLGVIILIATPKVISTINFSKEKAAQETVRGFVDAFDLFISEGNNITDGTYVVRNGKLCNGECTENNQVSLKGKNINTVNGTIQIKDNEIEFDSSFCIGKFKMTYSEEGIKTEDGVCISD